MEVLHVVACLQERSEAKATGFEAFWCKSIECRLALPASQTPSTLPPCPSKCSKHFLGSFWLIRTWIEPECPISLKLQECFGNISHSTPLFTNLVTIDSQIVHSMDFNHSVNQQSINPRTHLRTFSSRFFAWSNLSEASIGWRSLLQFKMGETSCLPLPGLMRFFRGRPFHLDGHTTYFHQDNTLRVQLHFIRNLQHCK